MKQFWHFQKVNAKKYYILFVRVHIKRYWNFHIDTTTQDTFCQSSYKTMLTFLESCYQTILRTFFRVQITQYIFRSLWKIIPHIFSEFISNNIDSSRIATKKYRKIILIYDFVSNEIDICSELLPNTKLFPRMVHQAMLLSLWDLNLR